MKPTEGVILLNISLGRSNVLRPPLHWMAGTWKKPPLDVELDPETGLMRAIQFVIQDEKIVTAAQSSVPIENRFGVPNINIANWPSNRYLSESLEVTAGWSSEEDLYIGIETAGGNVLACSVDNSLEILFIGSSMALGGIRVIGLSDQEIMRLTL